jgi:pilus assembly protein CpaF
VISPPSQAKGPVFAVIVSEKGGAERREVFDVTELSVGRVQGNDLMLPKGNVSKRHARLLYRDGRFIVTDLNSTNGTYVNRRRIAQATIVREGDRIYIGDFVLRIELLEADADLHATSSGPMLAGRPSRIASEPSEPTVSRRVQPDARAVAVSSQEGAEAASRPRAEAPSTPDVARPELESFADVSARVELKSSPDAYDDRSSPRVRLALLDAQGVLTEKGEREGFAALGPAPSQLGIVFERVAAALAIDKQHCEIDLNELQRVNEQLEEALGKADELELPTGVSTDQVKALLRAELSAFGPIGALLDDPEVSEISIGRFDRIVVKRDGKSMLAPLGFSCERALELTLARLCRRCGFPLASGERILERRLPDGTRLSAVLGSAAPEGAFAVLSKNRPPITTLDDLVRRGTLSRIMATFLQQAVMGRANLLLVGARDAGISALVNALSAACDDPTLLAVEDAEELLASSPRTRRLRMGDSDRAFETLRVALRASDARPVVELARGEVIAATLEAVGAGAEGMVGTLRAPALPAAMMRLAAAVAAARPGIDLRAAREWLCGSFDLAVEVRALADGRHRILRIAELSPGDQGIALQDVFTFVVERTAAGGAIEGSFNASGVVPRLVEQLIARGHAIETSLFTRPPSR